MSSLLKKAGKPADFWAYFEKISQIPRCSGNEAQIRSFISGEAQKFGYETQQDSVGNLLVRLPPSSDLVQKTVILQAHLDMVCEKNQGIAHDFSQDPLSLQIIEQDPQKWLTAKGTTLGADNGVGLAYLLALMKKIHDSKLSFEGLAIHLLFTVDEESGLVGAFEIESQLIEGNFLLNLDSEEDDTFTIGCAGGINTTGILSYNPIQIATLEDDYKILRLSVSGLKGGHSGVDIHRGRANALKIISKMLWKINNEHSLLISSLNGGNRPNAIPRESKCSFLVPTQDLNSIIQLLSQTKSDIEKGISGIEPEMVIEWEPIEKEEMKTKTVLPAIISTKLLHMLYIMPNGPISYDAKNPDLVYTSTNLASVQTEEENNTLRIITSQRSLHEISKKIIYEKVEALFKLADLDIKIEHAGDYPGWTPEWNSPLVQRAKDAYQHLFDTEAKIRVIHAGLECGILKQHNPHLDTISFGPTIKGAHSPDERLNLQSVEKIWKLLHTLLKNLL